MSEYSCFDIIGPIMVGPSSSHTAGAEMCIRDSSTGEGNSFLPLFYLFCCKNNKCRFIMYSIICIFSMLYIVFH